jgi:hypothetical protein
MTRDFKRQIKTILSYNLNTNFNLINNTNIKYDLCYIKFLNTCVLSGVEQKENTLTLNQFFHVTWRGTTTKRYGAVRGAVALPNEQAKGLDVLSGCSRRQFEKWRTEMVSIISFH